MTKLLPAAAELTDIVWVQTGFIGDIVLTTAAIEAARLRLPEVRQHVITTPVGASVLAGSPPLASRIVFDKNGRGSTAGAFLSARSQLKAALDGRPGAVLLQAHRSHRSSLLCRFLGLPTVTYAESNFARLATRRVARVALLHEAHRIGLLLEPLGVARADICAAQPVLAPLPLDAKAAVWQMRLAAHTGRVVAVAPGSVWATKRWTPQGFAAVLGGLRRMGDDVLIVLLGSAAEKKLADDLEAGVPSRQMLNLAGATNLDDLRRVMPRLALLVSNDSSPIHYASAFNVPTVAVFGATVPAMGFGPLAPRSLALGLADLACRPCSDHGPAVCPLGHFRCMKDLGAQPVLAACAKVLGVAAPGAPGAKRAAGTEPRASKA